MDDTATDDVDGDGFGAGGDCDDNNAEVHPEADEICNNLDDDCDGLIDQGAVDAVVVWADADTDGFGDPAASLTTCAPTAEQVTNDGDCDDQNAAIFPDAAEVCNEVDDDCDGLTDDADDTLDPSDLTPVYADADADGFGDAADPGTIACVPPEGVLSNTDCDDTDAATFPGSAAVEGALLCTTDADGDGYGDAEPAVGVTPGQDCDDTNRAVSPGSPEVTDDGLDNNCDGAEQCGVDADGDGFAETTGATVDSDDLDCDDPGEASRDLPETDCDDTSADTSPAANEACNGLDDDCDGLLDDADPSVVGSAVWYLDADGDNFGGVDVAVESCSAPGGYVADATDCQDLDPRVYPGATERCNGMDDDCDGLDDVAEGLSSGLGLGEGANFYIDADGDSYGDPTTGALACSAPSGSVADATDCDDTNAQISPAAAEICNSLDDDCDGGVDDADPDGVSGTSTWYTDNDGDGAGDPAAELLACTLPAGAVSIGDDCDDTDAAVAPDAVEVCNGYDDDCDAQIDDADPELDLSSGLMWYADVDLDGAGDPDSGVWACVVPDGYVVVNDDCDDTTSDVYPGAPETCNERDDDCDGAIDRDDPDFDPATLGSWYVDGDGDGHGAGAAISACDAPSGTVAGDADCDDADATISPDAVEQCNEQDDDCDTLIDDADPDLDLGSGFAWYPDADGDGYGDENSEIYACDQPVGTLSTGDDCDDSTAAVSPADTEVCNSIDDDCDGRSDDNDPTLDHSTRSSWYADRDRDGYGNNSIRTESCTAPSGAVSLGDDCDDYLAAVNPGATEVCNGDDDDCDTLIDDADPSVSTSSAVIYYVDADEDGFGDSSSTALSCDAPDGYVLDDTDCDDGEVDTNPLASEICDGLDNNCDGSVPGDELDADGDSWSTCEGDPDDTDASAIPEVSVVVANHSSSYNATRYFRSNVYYATDTVELLEFEPYLGLSSTCTLGFFVYSAPSTSGARTLLWSNSVSTAAGTGYMSSGPISGVTMNAGTYYVIGVGWDCNASYYGQSGSGLTTVDYGFGTFAVNAWSNTYTGYSPGFVPGSTGSNSLAYEQRITYAP